MPLPANRLFELNIESIRFKSSGFRVNGVGGLLHGDRHKPEVPLFFYVPVDINGVSAELRGEGSRDTFSQLETGADRAPTEFSGVVASDGGTYTLKLFARRVR